MVAAVTLSVGRLVDSTTRQLQYWHVSESVSLGDFTRWLPALSCYMLDFLPLQNPHKFFPDERFGDESPLLTVRQSGRCRVNSTPTAETMFTELDSFVAFHPPLPPPPPPYHPPATPIHNQFKVGWKQRVPSQHPSRSFSYPCNHSLFHSRTAPKAAPPVYLPGVKAAPPDCTNTAALGRQTVAAAAAVMAAEKQVVSIGISLLLPISGHSKYLIEGAGENCYDEVTWFC